MKTEETIMSLSALIAKHAVGQAVVKLAGNAGKAYHDASIIESYIADNSLVSFTESSRVEPLTIVGTDCMHLDYLPDVLQSLLSIFSGYYLQALAMTTQINGTSVTKHLDRLNPNRKGDLVGSALSIGNTNSGTDWKLQSKADDWRLSNLAYEHRLPTRRNLNAMAFEQIAVEENVNKGDPKNIYSEARNARDEAKNRREEEKNTREQEKHDAEKDKKTKEDELKNTTDAQQAIKDEEEKAAIAAGSLGKPAAAILSDKEIISTIKELTNLSVGKMFNVSIGGGVDVAGKEVRAAIIPVSVRLMVNNISDSSLVNLLAGGSMDNSLSERYHAWRAGRIDFIRDLVFCQDIIDEYKKALIHDHSGVHGEILRRVNNAKTAGLAQRNPSLNVASNLFVISEATAANIEHKLGGKLNNPHVRSKIFDSGYAMIIAIIDRQWERITFYHRGIALGTSVSLRDIRISNKGTGPDVTDIMKAYMMGNAPTL